MHSLNKRNSPTDANVEVIKRRPTSEQMEDMYIKRVLIHEHLKSNYKNYDSYEIITQVNGYLQNWKNDLELAVKFKDGTVENLILILPMLTEGQVVEKEETDEEIAQKEVYSFALENTGKILAVVAECKKTGRKDMINTEILLPTNVRAKELIFEYLSKNSHFFAMEQSGMLFMKMLVG